MRNRLSGLTGHKTILETVYNYEDYASELDLTNFFTFTPKEFLESIYRVKTYTVTGQVTGRAQEFIGNSHQILGHDLGSASISINFNQRPFSLVRNQKPPQIQNPVDWFSKNNDGVIQNYPILYRDQHVTFQPNYTITEKNCAGTISVDTRYWNYNTQPPGDYGHTATLTNLAGYDIYAAVDCSWDRIFYQGKLVPSYYNKKENVYYVLPPLNGAVFFHIPPTVASSAFDALNFLTTSKMPVGKQAGTFTYYGWDGNHQSVPIYASKYVDGYNDLDFVSCDITLVASEVWQDSDF